MQCTTGSGMLYRYLLWQVLQPMQQRGLYYMWEATGPPAMLQLVYTQAHLLFSDNLSLRMLWVYVGREPRSPGQ
jgi:hypothetical protein